MEVFEEIEGTVGAAGTVLTAVTNAAEISENVKEETKAADVEIIHTVETVTAEESEELQHIVETAEMPTVESLQSIADTRKTEESKALQKIFEEIEQEEAAQRRSEEAVLTKFMVSNVIDDLISENAAAEDINAQINHIIEELIAESEAREQEEAALQQSEQTYESRISDKKKIDVLKTIARRHKIWTWLGLGLVIAGACLIIYMKNKKSKEE